MKKILSGMLAVAPLISQAAEPQTLLQMAGVKAPFNPRAAAVVLIDFQQEYTQGKLPLHQIEKVVRDTRELLDWARARQLPVIHVFHEGNAGGVFDPKTPSFQPIPELAPIAGEAVVYKKLPNSFAGTDLEKKLKAQGRDSLIVTGLMTHMCVEASVRAGFDLGFKPVIVASTTTTRDLPLGNEVVKAEVLRDASLAAVSDLVAGVDADLKTLQARFE